MPPLERPVVVKRLFDNCGFATAEAGSDVYLDANTVRNTSGLYVGRELWAQIVPSKRPGQSPVARNIRFEPPAPSPSEYNPTLSAEERELWKLFLQLKEQYHLPRLSRPLPARRVDQIVG